MNYANKILQALKIVILGALLFWFFVGLIALRAYSDAKKNIILLRIGNEQQIHKQRKK